MQLNRKTENQYILGVEKCEDVVEEKQLVHFGVESLIYCNE